MQEYDAVIIGAGWAGIRAAQTLLESGVSSLLVLEANDYIGGRIKSINLGDDTINDASKLNNMANIPIDLGGEWSYSYNDMEETLISEGYTDNIEMYSDRDQYLDLFTAQYYLQLQNDVNSNAVQALTDTEASQLRVIWNEYLDFRKDLLESTPDGEALSVADAAEQFKQSITLNNAQLQYFNLILNAGQIDYTADISELNLEDYKWNSESNTCEMTYLSQVGVGFGNVADHYAKQHTSDTIKTNSRVTEINYEDPDITIISYTENGDTTKKIAARTVLMTVSLGVLKAGTINFVPTLPDWKQDVIDKMGFGVMNKWIGVWDAANVWPNDGGKWFQLITPEDDTSGKWTSFFNPTEFKDGVPTLIGWIGGDDAWEMEDQTDEEVTDDVMKNLQVLFPGITRPDRVLVTRWGKENNIYGTYTFKPVGRDYKEDSQALRRNIGRIRFAGESTDTVWYGTTYGAWMTGEEEAREMVTEIANLPPRYVPVATGAPSKRPSVSVGDIHVQVVEEAPTDSPNTGTTAEPTLDDDATSSSTDTPTAGSCIQESRVCFTDASCCSGECDANGRCTAPIVEEAPTDSPNIIVTSEDTDDRISYLLEGRTSTPTTKLVTMTSEDVLDDVSSAKPPAPTLLVTAASKPTTATDSPSSLSYGAPLDNSSSFSVLSSSSNHMQFLVNGLLLFGFYLLY